MTVHLVLDVDGVLNALTSKPPTDVWSLWNTGTATPHDGGREFTIRWSPNLVDGLNKLTSLSHVQPYWLTSWGASAKTEIAPLLHLDGAELWPLLTDDNPVQSFSDGWWKLKNIVETPAKTGDVIIWIDDDIKYERLDVAVCVSFFEERGVQLLTVSPDAYSGITPEELAKVTSWCG